MPLISRRNCLAAGAVAAMLTTLRPNAALASSGREQRFPIWTNQPPGSEGIIVVEEEILRRPDADPEDTAWLHVCNPTLTYFPAVNGNGAAILLIPGGGYRQVGVGLGTLAIGRHFASFGFATYMLIYRLPADGWAAGPDAPLQDAQRALRLVRSRAAQDGFDAERIGVIGGSAGGHLAARLMARQDIQSYIPQDEIDYLPLTTKAGCLLFPVIALNGEAAHQGSRDELFGQSAEASAAASYAGDALIVAGTPPIYLAHAMDDRSVPWINSVMMMRALCAAGVSTEAHFFERGGHGFDIGGETGGWVEEFLTFASRHALF